MFAAALDQPPTSRPLFVRQACADDTDLFQSVLELLDLHDQLSAVDAPPVGDAPGRRIGPYEIVRLLGAGGMGQVYLARRADGSFQRDVAIKFLDPDRGDAVDLHRRFEQERRILASLRHPHIAALIDAGTTASGRLYFVMEYVDGRSITEYCEERNLGLRARVELFLRICDAVSYAHRNLIVHRDLKPANILVDADGQPKLLDFGIAKAVTRAAYDPDPTDPFHKRATPAYASPEHLAGGPARTSMDVYALGVILHELVTGARPPRAEPDVTTRTKGVARASDAVARDSAADVAAAVRHESTISPRELRGDLDAIIAKALAADARQRYGSVDSLADDLRSWAADRPVSARDGGTFYRARKFARRNRGIVVAGTVAVASAIVALAVITQLWLATARDRDRTARQFGAVRTLAVSLFSVDERLSAVPGTTNIRRLLVETIGTYLAAAELSDNRELLLDTARAYRQLGDVEGNPNGAHLGNPSRALAHYERAIGILNRVGPATGDAQVSAALARTFASRGDVYMAQAALDRADADYAAALALASELTKAHPDEAEYQELLAGIHRPRGDVRLARGDVAGALAEYQRALALDEAVAASAPGRPGARRLRALTQIRLGDARLASGAPAAAREHYEQATRILESLTEDGGHRRDLLRDAALGFARLGALGAASGDPAGRAELESAVAIFRQLASSDPTDARARRDLMVALLQYSDAAAPVDPPASRAALLDARQIASRFSADAPADTERARELAAIEARLARGGAGERVILNLVSGDGPIAAGDEPPRLGTALRAQATAPPGWMRYLLVFGAEGPAEMLDEAALARTRWTVPVTGPVPSQTVLLIATPRSLTAQDRQQLTDSLAAVTGPRVVDVDSHIVWTDRSERVESLAAARGARDTRWVQDVQARVAALGVVKISGRTFPVAPATP